VSGAYVAVTTTVASAEDAERLAAALVERRLAACVQIDGPIVSRYRWHGALERANEWRCTLKTRAALFDAVAAAIAELHTYEVPEIVATDLDAVAPAYAAWIDETTSSPSSRSTT
jgi:periplasmic divalent cation tolerance protein